MTNQSKLLELVKQQIEQSIGLNESELNQMIYSDSTVLHDPFLMKNMTELVQQLNQIKTHQEKKPTDLIVIDTDYDTDGVMSAAVLGAALNVLGFAYRIYTPTRTDGYGLSPQAVKKMLRRFQRSGYHIHTILTADNGTNAVDGVAYAQSKGINVLVTDHHLSNSSLADTLIVNPNQQGDTYPFKGNAGATVAWKVMQAYTQMYEPDKQSLIDDLIVFAGIANVADVMPILDENHYMVRQSVEEIQRLMGYRYVRSPYPIIKSTGYPIYDSVFHGLFDLIVGIQTAKDEVRKKKGKKPFPLPLNEELIGWYISPTINATSRVTQSPATSMKALLINDQLMRDEMIQFMIEKNDEKTVLTQYVMDSLDGYLDEKDAAHIIIANTQPGIVGLVAGRIAEKTGKPALVFGLHTDHPKAIYAKPELLKPYLGEQYDALVLTGSARSNPTQPLDEIVSLIQTNHPNLEVGGGGHEQAAGVRVPLSKYQEFVSMFKYYAAEVLETNRQRRKEALELGKIKPAKPNRVVLDLTKRDDTPQQFIVNKETFHQDIRDVYVFSERLRPYGKDFNPISQFYLQIEPAQLNDPIYQFDPHFWKTFKFRLYGVEVLTFNVELAEKLKSAVTRGQTYPIWLRVDIKENVFRGKTTMQLMVEKLLDPPYLSK